MQSMMEHDSLEMMDSIQTTVDTPSVGTSAWAAVTLRAIRVEREVYVNQSGLIQDLTYMFCPDGHLYGVSSNVELKSALYITECLSNTASTWSGSGLNTNSKN